MSIMGLRGMQNKERVMGIKDKPRKRTQKHKKISTSDFAPELPSNLNPKEDSVVDDLYWIYNQLGGKEALLKMLKDDAKTKKDFLKTLLQHETKKLEKSSGNGGGGSKKGKLFILKGLYEGNQDTNGVAEAKKFQNILDPLSQKNDVSEAEEFKYTAIEPEEIIIEEEVVVEEEPIQEV